MANNNQANLSSRFPFVKSLDLDLEVERKLSLNLQGIVDGRSDVFLTPMAKEYGENLLSSEFDKVFNTGRSKMNSTLITLEELNRAKIGPRSQSVPWSERREALLSSFERKVSGSLVGGIDSSGSPKLRPISLSNALDLLKRNTNSGLPCYTRKGNVLQRTFERFKMMLSRRDPCVLFTRTQEQRKTRSVWGYPMADTLNEMCFYAPLLSFQRKLSYRAAIVSPEEVSRQMTNMVLSAIRLGHILLSIDFTGYDTSVGRTLIQMAFNYIKSLFQSRYSSDLDYICERFCTIGIVTPEGVKDGEHGIPSGSTFTNEVGSLIQYLIATACKIVMDAIQVQGDDGVYRLESIDAAEALKDEFRSHGLEVNDEKSYISSNYAIYLQNLYHVDYLKDGIIGGIYPVYRALNRLMYQERWSDFEDYGITGKDFYSIRAICIVENCKYHPLFKELVQFVLAHDKYSLSVTDQGIRAYLQMVTSNQGAGEILNHQYGDDASGIKSFETYKMVKALG